MPDNAALKVYALHCGGDRTPLSISDPFDPDCGRIAYNPYYMYVITHPRGNVLLDTGAHPSLHTNPPPARSSCWRTPPTSSPKCAPAPCRPSSGTPTR